MALLLALAATASRLGGAVHLVDQHQVRAELQERLAIGVTLDRVDAGNEVAIVGKDAPVGRRLAFEPRHRAGADDHGVDVKLLCQFALPLLAQIGRAQHGQPSRHAAVQQLTSNQPSLDGLAHAHVVGNQQPHGLLSQRHHQRHELVGAGPHRKMAKRTKGRGAVAQQQPRRFHDQAHCRQILYVVRRRQREVRWRMRS